MRSVAIAVCSLALISANQPDDKNSSGSDAESNEKTLSPNSLLPTFNLSSSQANLIEKAQVEADTPLPTDKECRNRITQLREERGLPALDDEPFDRENAMTIYAVDFRQDGCAMLVVRGDRNDIRPLPDHPDGPLQFIPVDGRD